MHENPFSPSFSIRPERFFGRASELDMMRAAFGNPDSPHRFLFMTGTRGCGKTSLLHQFAVIAEKEMGWDVIEATYQDCIERLASYSGARIVNQRASSLAPSISAGGVSASAFAISRESSEPAKEHLVESFVSKACGKSRSKGVLVLIDEVQKIAERDMEEVCHAIQGAKTAGANVALVIAGLPFAFGKIRRFAGCTFVQRMKRYRLGMMGMTDTRGLLQSMFGLVPEIEVAPDVLEEMAAFSGGHPYLLQLLGSYAYDVAFEQGLPHAGAVVELDSSMLHEAEIRALADYRENVLANLLVGLRNGSKEYLRALCEVSDENSTARTADVAAFLGKNLRECSAQRARIIDLQLAIPAGRGLLRLSLPYLPLAFDTVDDDDAYGVDEDDAWIPRKLPFQ